ncbi:hypothetical protein ASwh1_107 [Aeromonas phage Aswh_1]|nr:hypothetical protein ASwh1_107 [Aeromonas phage Aswh_1]
MFIPLGGFSRTLMRVRGDYLRTQATHTDQFGALYKYVNGRLFHFRWYRGYPTPSRDLAVWGIFNTPKNHEIFPIVK